MDQVRHGGSCSKEKVLPVRELWGEARENVAPWPFQSGRLAVMWTGGQVGKNLAGQGSGSARKAAAVLGRKDF